MAKKRKSYPDSLKKKVVNAIEGGMTQKEAAQKFKVGINSIPQWLKAHRSGTNDKTGNSAQGNFKAGHIDMKMEVPLDNNKSIRLWMEVPFEAVGKYQISYLEGKISSHIGSMLKQMLKQ